MWHSSVLNGSGLFLNIFMKILTVIFCNNIEISYLCNIKITIEPAATDKRHKIMKTTLSNNQEIEIVKNEERKFISVTVNGRTVITVSTSCTREGILEKIEFSGLKHIKEPSFMDYKKLEDCAKACKALEEEIIDAILAVKNQEDKEAESIKSNEEKETATATTIDEVVEVAKGIAQERGLNISFMIKGNIIEGGRNLKTSESYEFDFEDQSVIYDKTRDKVASAIILEAIDKIKASDSIKYESNQDVNMNDRERIGKRIAEIRKSKGISQSKLCSLTGIGSGHIARIESGKYSTGIDVLSKIATALDCRLDIVECEIAVPSYMENEMEEAPEEAIVDYYIPEYPNAIIMQDEHFYSVNLRTGLGAGIYPKKDFTLKQAIEDQINL